MIRMNYLSTTALSLLLHRCPDLLVRERGEDYSGVRARAILGTIAGDDTILVITLDSPTGEAIQEKFLDLIEKG